MAAMVSSSVSANLRAYLVVATVVVLCYANSLSNAFVFDDTPLLLSDPGSLALDRLPGHFTGEEGFNKTMGRYYRPLVSVTYAVDRLTSRALFGRMDPRSFHATNLLIHLAGCWVLLALLLLLFERPSAALMATLVFAVHPIHTESVAWISGRTDSLAGLFYFTAFLAYLRYARTPKALWLWVLFTSYGLALLSKEMAVTLPAALVLFDLLQRNQRAPQRSRLRIYAALVGLTILFLVVRQAALTGKVVPPEGQYFFGQPSLTVLGTMLQTLPVYARLLTLPTGLLYHYNGVLPYQASLLAGEVLLALLFLVVTLALACWCRRREPLVALSILFFYLSLLPVLNIVPTFSLMAERFLFIPSFSMVLLIGWLLNRARGPELSKAATFACLLLIGWYGVLTFERNRDWKTNDTLFRSAEGTPGSLLNVNLGNAYSRSGDVGKAERLYLEALELREQNARAHLNLGIIQMFRGAQAQGAAAQADGTAERDRARAYRAEATAWWDQARQHLERARELEPGAPEMHFELAQLALVQGRKREALAHLNVVQQLAPGFPGLTELRLQIEQ